MSKLTKLLQWRRRVVPGWKGTARSSQRALQTPLKRVVRLGPNSLTKLSTPGRARDPGHEKVFHRNSMGYYNWFKSIAKYPNAKKFCTCHNNVAVLPDAKFHSYNLAESRMTFQFNLNYDGTIVREMSSGPNHLMGSGTKAKKLMRWQLGELVKSVCMSSQSFDLISMA